MELLRKIYRIPVFLLWFVCVAVFCRLFNHGAKASERSLAWTLVWARVSAWIFNLKIHVAGDPAAFKGGLIAANHQGVLDILVLASVFKIRFAPKAEMRRWPLIGFLTGCNKPVWIDRSTPRKAKESAEAMCRTMRSGQAMMVFPEGTTSDGKEGLLPFKSTAFQAAIDAGCSVLPVIISYDANCRSRVQWCHGTSFPAFVWSILGLKETKVTVHIMECVRPLDGEDRKALCGRVYELMNRKWRNV